MRGRTVPTSHVDELRLKVKENERRELIFSGIGPVESWTEKLTSKERGKGKHSISYSGGWGKGGKSRVVPFKGRLFIGEP